MHNWKLYVGGLLAILAILSSIGVAAFGISFAGPLLVVVAALGGFLIVGGHLAMRGTWFWGGVILLLLAFLPSFGIVLVPALVFTGPLLVLVAIAGGYLIAAKHGRR